MMSWPPLDPTRLLFSGVYSGPAALAAGFSGQAWQQPQKPILVAPEPARQAPAATEQCTELLPPAEPEAATKVPARTKAAVAAAAPTPSAAPLNFNEITTHIFQNKLKSDPQYASVNWADEGEVLKYIDRLRFVGWVSDYMFEKSAPEEKVLKSKLYTDLVAKISETIWKDIVVRNLCQMVRLQKI
jgi:hypothetical protein